MKQTRVGFSTDALVSLMKKILKDQVKTDKRLKSFSKGVIELVWVDDKEIQKLNRSYRGKNKPTDVLSFSYLDDKKPDNGQEWLLGQIIISVPTLRRQAQQQKHALSLEAKVLFVHGMLHLLGFDHEKKSDLEQMMRAERKYLGDKSGLISRAHPE